MDKFNEKTEINAAGDFAVTQSHPEMNIVETRYAELEIDFKFLKQFPKAQVVGEECGFIFSNKYKAGSTIGLISEWQMVINPCFLDGKGIPHISFLLSMSHLQESIDFADTIYELSILDPQKNPLHKKSSQVRRFTRKKSLFGWDTFVPLDLLGSPPTITFSMTLHILGGELSHEELNSYLEIQFPSDLHYLKIPKEYCADEYEEIKQDVHNLQSKKSESPHTNGFKKYIWNNGSPLDPDSSVLSFGNSFPVHIFILADKSSVFAKHFEGLGPHDFLSIKEREMGVILEYCYTGELGNFMDKGLLDYITLWWAVIFLKIEEMSDKISLEILKFLDRFSFKNVFTMYKKSVEVFEVGRVATIKDFIAYVRKEKKLNGNSKEFFSDFEGHELEYVQILFEEY